MANSLTSSSRDLKHSGISYSIKDFGVEYADKITTIGTSNYPLIDAHYIDWDSSVVKNVAYIPSKLFDKFCKSISPAKGNFKLLKDVKFNRDRYVGEKYYENVRSDEPDDTFDSYIPPTWYANGEHPTSFVTSSETLDLIDYLTFVSTYTFNLVENLYEMQGSITPVLKFSQSEILNYHGKIDPDFNVIEDSIDMVIYPNQTNPKFSEIGFPMFLAPINKRNFKLTVFAFEGNTIIEISDPMFYTDSDDMPRLQCSNYDHDVKTKTPFGGIDVICENGTSLGSDTPVKQFTIRPWTSGWAPIMQKGETALIAHRQYGWDDTREAIIILQTAATTMQDSENQFSESKPLILHASVTKDPNIFEYIYINGVRYFYLKKDYFNNCAEIDNKYKNAAFLISENDLSASFESMSPNDFLKDKLYEKLICVSAYDSNHALFVSNGKLLEFEIYPKYFGDSLDEDNQNVKTSGKIAKYCGELDLFDTQDNAPISIEATVLDAKQSITANPVFEAITECHRTINGINRKGFKTKITINQNIISDERRTDLLITASPTKYVGGMVIKLRCISAKSWPVFFIDNTKGFNLNNWLYDNTVTPVADFNMLSQKISIGLVNSEIKGWYGIDTGYEIPEDKSTVPYKFVGNLKLPIYTWRSWGVSSDENKNKIITPSTVSADKNNGILQNPSASEIVNAGMFNKAFETLYNVDSMFLKFLPETLKDKNFTDDVKNLAVRYTKGYPSIFLGFTGDAIDEARNPNRLKNKIIGAYKRGAKNGDNYTRTDVSGKIQIDFAATYLANIGFIDQCSAAFKEEIEKYSNNESKGKVFCSRYCGIKREDIKDLGRVCYLHYLVFFKPTIPDNLIATDVESQDLFKYIDNRPTNIEHQHYIDSAFIKNQRGEDTTSKIFKLILKVPASTADSNINNIYDESILEINLAITRADFELAGWAGRAEDGATKTTELLFAKKYNIHDIISSNAFSAGKHNLQTRLTSTFAPSISATSESEKYTKLSDDLYINYVADPIQALTFYSQQKDSKIVLKYKIDDQISHALYGNMLSDEIFRGLYGDSKMPINMSIVRKEVDYFDKTSNDANNVFGSHNLHESISCINYISPAHVISTSGKSIGRSVQFIIKLQDNDIEHLRDFKFNVFTNFMQIIDNKFKDIYNVTDANAIKMISQMVITGKASKRFSTNIDNVGEVEEGSFRNMWDKLQFSEKLTNIFVENDTYYDNGIKTITMNPTSEVGKFYYDSDTPVDNMNDLIYVDSNGDVCFTDALITNLKTETSYKSLRLRVIGVLPMTDLTKGFLYDVKLSICLRES